MKNHFVPQFYLRFFCENPTPEGREPWLWVVDLQERTVTRRAPKNVAVQSDYYLTAEIEQALAKLESAATPVLAKLNGGGTDLSEGERSTFAYFIAIFVGRVPFFRNMMETKMGEVGRMNMLIAAQHPEHFARLMREALPGQEVTPEQIEKQRQWTLKGNYMVRGAPGLSLELGLSTAEVLAPMILDMKWAYMIPRDESCFLTCDNPVSWFDPTPRPAALRASGLAMRNVELTFPIGPRLCLLSTWDGSVGPCAVGPKGLRIINERRAAFASRFAFASRETEARTILTTFPTEPDPGGGDAAHPGA
jgi:hypothetical protein